MPGRGNNNKHGSVGRGSNNTSSQPFIQDSLDEPRSNHARKQSGGEPSVKQSKKIDTSANRDIGIATGKLKSERAGEKSFDLLVDEVPYFVRAVPFSFNDERRFYISVNGGADHVFAWDLQVGRFRAIDDTAAILPDAVETEISAQLQSQHK